MGKRGWKGGAGTLLGWDRAQSRRARRLLALGVALHASIPVVGAPRARPPAGHTQSLEVRQTDAPPLIDGKLDEAVWEEAPVATGFWISGYQRAPKEQTEVRVLADETALYFAFFCRDSRPEKIHAIQLKRDAGMGVDDRVTVQLDPYHSHRQISEFTVNAAGTQADAMAGGRARKIEWKGDWQGAAERTPEGWTAEMAIPFAILNFQPGARTFGANFLRYHHRTQEVSRWADVTAQMLPEEMGHLTGLALPREGKANRLTVMQYGAAGINSPDKRGNLQDRFATTGADIRYDMANNLTSVLSVNPDFSQVEDEVLGPGFDYNERLAADRRPFFQEGAGFFGNRAYFHSGRVPSFDVGVKSFGKVGSNQVGFLGTQAPGARRDYAARFVREFGPTVSAGATVVGTQRSAFDNHLMAVEAAGRTKRGLVASANVAATTTQGRAGDGARVGLSVGHQSPYWQAGIGVDRTEKDFFPANGFIAGDVLGTQGASAYASYGREFAGGPLRRVDGSVTYGARDTLTGLSQSRKLSVYAGAQTRSNIAVNVGTTVGPYRPRGRQPGQWAAHMNDDRFYTASVYFDTDSDRRGYGLTYSWGFLGGGEYSDLAPSFWFRPDPKTHVSYSYERAESFGTRTQNVLGVSRDISPEEGISARWVGSAGNSYRLAYRRQVRQGTDIFAVFNTDPYSPDRFAVKLVKTFGVGGGRRRAAPPEGTIPFPRGTRVQANKEARVKGTQERTGKSQEGESGRVAAVSRLPRSLRPQETRPSPPARRIVTARPAGTGSRNRMQRLSTPGARRRVKVAARPRSPIIERMERQRAIMRSRGLRIMRQRAAAEGRVWRG